MDSPKSDTESYRSRAHGGEGRPWWQLTPYIDTEKKRQNLKDHKYAGADEGLSYIYCYNPLAVKFVSWLPKTIAPNTLTLLGFANTLIPLTVLFAVCGCDLYGTIPNWFMFLQAWCYFTYRMLDEMDGKQARATQNSSPLGLIFDHGCDSFTSGL